MYYQEYLPSPAASALVQCYWTLKGDYYGFHEVLPDGHTDIIFNFSEALTRKKGKHPQLNTSKIFVVGNMTKPLLSGASNNKFDLLGIRFKATGLYSLIRQPLNELTDIHVDINDLDFAPSQLFNLPETSNTIQLINYLDRLFQKIEPLPDKRISHSIQWIIRSKGCMKISALADAACLSQKQLERLFLIYTGISPKVYSDTIRFTELHKLIHQPIPRIDILSQLGFYDNSHMQRFYKRFVST